MQLSTQPLGDGLTVMTGRLPSDLLWDESAFTAAWELHPSERHRIQMIGKWIETPRWQQAYGADYAYTGSRNNALPIPQSLAPLLGWIRRDVDNRLNGLLLNWYEGRNDYIGPHHDSTKGMIEGAPIVTVSFGETREFHLEQRTSGHRRKIVLDATHGSVIALPFSTNLIWKHSVPVRARYSGRRISVTFRGFESGVLPADRYWQAG